MGLTRSLDNCHTTTGSYCPQPHCQVRTISSPIKIKSLKPSTSSNFCITLWHRL
uniref:Uncharacterized protein n=1 Tax=Arundo donax TaxID=35708 RepID=A0A0A9BE34_ARUDO